MTRSLQAAWWPPQRTKDLWDEAEGSLNYVHVFLLQGQLPPFAANMYHVLLLLGTNCSHSPKCILLHYTPPSPPCVELSSDVFLPTLHLGRSQSGIKSHNKELFPISFSWKIYTNIHTIHTYLHIHTYIHVDMHIHTWVCWHIYVLFMLNPLVLFKYYLANDVWMDQCMKQMTLCQITEY